MFQRRRNKYLNIKHAGTASGEPDVCGQRLCTAWSWFWSDLISLFRQHSQSGVSTLVAIVMTGASARCQETFSHNNREHLSVSKWKNLDGVNCKTYCCAELRWEREVWGIHEYMMDAKCKCWIRFIYCMDAICIWFVNIKFHVICAVQRHYFCLSANAFENTVPHLKGTLRLVMVTGTLLALLRISSALSTAESLNTR